MPDSSNYTFLVRVSDGDLDGLGIYKPRRGERPLWDFPRGTLCQREAAAFLVSSTLGWNIIPPTVLRDAEPHGFGSVQLYIDADPDIHYFSLRGTNDDLFKRIAAFDILVNNADRKGGHVLQSSDGTGLGHRPWHHLPCRAEAAHGDLGICRTADPGQTWSRTFGHSANGSKRKMIHCPPLSPRCSIHRKSTRSSVAPHACYAVHNTLVPAAIARRPGLRSRCWNTDHT